MMQRNCPNCSAPYDAVLNKCPYCGTSYYDLSALDLTAREPFYLKIKVDINGSMCYITQLVKPRMDMSMNFSSDSVDCYGGIGNKLATYTRSRSLTTSLSFEAVTTGSHLCTIEVE